MPTSHSNIFTGDYGDTSWVFIFQTVIIIYELYTMISNSPTGITYTHFVKVCLRFRHMDVIFFRNIMAVDNKISSEHIMQYFRECRWDSNNYSAKQLMLFNINIPRSTNKRFLWDVYPRPHCLLHFICISYDLPGVIKTSKVFASKKLCSLCKISTDLDNSLKIQSIWDQQDQLWSFPLCNERYLQ